MKTAPTPANPAQAATLAILELTAQARSGDNQAIEALWRVGMLAADSLHGLTMNPATGPQARKLARRKTSWPFMLAAVSEIRTAKNTASNPEAFAEWIGLGRATGIKLKNPGKGGTRNFRRGSTSALAYRVRREIESDLKLYGRKSDAEILNGRYHTWRVGEGESRGKILLSNRKKFLLYVQAMRGIKNLSDEGQWMKAAELWLDVSFEGKADSPGVWPESVYKRAKEGRTVREVILTRIQEGLSSVIAPPSDKKPIA